MVKKKFRSLPSTPVGNQKPKTPPKTPLVKLLEEPKSDSESDSDFHPSDVSDEKINISEDEANQELAELADEASEYEMMKQYERMFNDEEDEKEKANPAENEKPKQNQWNGVSMDAEDDDDEDDDYKPVYEEQSEDDDWATQDMDREAIELMEDNEEFERSQFITDNEDQKSSLEPSQMLKKQKKKLQKLTPKASKVIKDKEQDLHKSDEDDSEDEDYNPVYEEQSEDDDWANQDMTNEAIKLIEDNDEYEKTQDVDMDSDEDDDFDEDAEDIDDVEDENDDFDEDAMFADDDGESEEEEQKLDGEEDDDEDFTAEGHQEELQKLIAEDPDFAKFIEEEEQDLLDFQEEEEEEEKPASEKTVLTLEMVQKASKVFSNPKSSKVELRQQARFAVKAFSACMVRISPDVPPSNYTINDDKVFDAIIRMCYTHLAQVLMTILHPQSSVIKKEEDEDDVSELLGKKEDKKAAINGVMKYKYWKEFSPLVKEYLRALNMFLMEVTSTNIMHSTLRAIIDNTALYVSFEKLVRNVIRILIRIWSRKTHDCRCLAFVALTKMTRLNPNLYSVIYKGCYVAYVASTRSVSLAGLPLVSFMQKSFAELTFLQPMVAYQYAFVYIRQLAIHLRNATIAKRKDLVQTIYNWQYIESLYLWTQVLSNLSKQRIVAQEGSKWLRDLIHPLIQIICGTMKAFNAHRYVPLKAHCVRMLLQLQKNCNIFVPTLSYAADLLSDLLKIDSNKPKKGKGTVKAYEMKEIIKFNSDALEEAGYRSRLAEEIRSLIIEASYVIRHHISFGDVYAPVAEQFRKFMKTYKNREEIPAFKKVFIILKNHNEKVELIMNANAVDLQSFASMDQFKADIDKATDELEKYYTAMKKREAAAEESRKNIEEKKDDDEEESSKPKKPKKFIKKKKYGKKAKV